MRLLTDEQAGLSGARGNSLTNGGVLSPDAQARIDQARLEAEAIMAAASTDADHLAFSWMQSRIQPDFADLIEAPQFAKPALIEGRNVAMESYFDRMAYEHFLITPTV